MVLAMGWRDCAGDWHGGQALFCDPAIHLGLESSSTAAIILLAFNKLIEFSPSLRMVPMIEPRSRECVLSSGLQEITNEGRDWLAVSGVRKDRLERRLPGLPILSRSSRSLHSQAHQEEFAQFRLRSRVITVEQENAQCAAIRSFTCLESS